MINNFCIDENVNKQDNILKKKFEWNILLRLELDTPLYVLLTHLFQNNKITRGKLICFTAAVILLFV